MTHGCVRYAGEDGGGAAGMVVALSEVQLEQGDVSAGLDAGGRRAAPPPGFSTTSR